VRVLVTGANGQLGRAFVAAKPAHAHLIALTHGELDIADERATDERIAASRPDVIINAAAYTSVDRAEREPEKARRVNVEGARNVATAAQRTRARLVHVSTDYVFDGEASTPYRPDARTNPLNVYGRTKLDGEQAVRSCAPERSMIVRTAWLYAGAGVNFMRTILNRLRDNGEAHVVADQIGTPTSASSLARVLWRVVELGELSGIHHWTDSGVASWYDFAVAIAEEGVAAGLLPDSVAVGPIGTVDYPTPAVRPRFSVLDKSSLVQATGLRPPHWRVSLRAELRQFEYA
jgi:dTDP-4-dehydrorhamnose reductase